MRLPASSPEAEGTGVPSSAPDSSLTVLNPDAERASSQSGDASDAAGCPLRSSEKAAISRFGFPYYPVSARVARDIAYEVGRPLTAAVA